MATLPPHRPEPRPRSDQAAQHLSNHGVKSRQRLVETVTAQHQRSAGLQRNTLNGDSRISENALATISAFGLPANTSWFRLIIYAASKMLRHSSILVTASHYADDQRRLTIGLGSALSGKTK